MSPRFFAFLLMKNFHCRVNSALMGRKNKPVMMFRITTLARSNDDFDFRFWQKVGPRGIFEAMSQMMEDHFKWGRRHVHPPGLQRHVAVLKRRGS